MQLSETQLIEAVGNNGAFSKEIPGVQLVWDSTSLGSFKQCPRRYLFEIILGRQQSVLNIHLTFGLLWHKGAEIYDKLRAQKIPHEEAQIEAVWQILLRANRWKSDDNNKNLNTLIRTLVWYTEWLNEVPLETYVTSDGTPAVELVFKLPLPFTSADGENYMFSGHMDKVGYFGEQLVVVDRKSTKSTINEQFWQKFSPDNQMSLYALAGNSIFNISIHGILVDAAQIAVNFTRFSRNLVPRSASMLEEWYGESIYWIKQAEGMAQARYWPANDKACFLCPFKKVCSTPPSTRMQWLNADFTSRVWDPTVDREE